MDDNRNLPAPKKGASSTIDICLGIVADMASVASAGGLPTNTIIEVIKAYKQKRLEAGCQVLIEQFREGRTNLEDIECEEFVPSGYRFFRAVQEGETLRTLRVFARIIAGQIESQALDSGNFSLSADALSGLPDRELTLLAEYLTQTEKLSSAQDTMNVQSYVEGILVPELYADPKELSAAASLLAGRGLLLGIDSAMVGGGGLTRYFASPFAAGIKKLAKDLD